MLDEDWELEYECPECGATFPEGAEKCPDCGTEFDWDEEPEYECPECGAKVQPDTKECPICKAQFVPEGWEDISRDEAVIEGDLPASDYEMLEAAVAETIVLPKQDEAEEAPEEGALGEEPEAPPSEEVAEEAPPEEVAEEADALEAAERAPQRYPGGFSLVGLVFIILSGGALIFTIVALRWDTLARGMEYESIGSTQMSIVMVGLVGFIVCAAISVYDLFRGPKEVD
jgi:DNA-directed RNA polymerase subunit RPC12/RpoP